MHLNNDGTSNASKIMGINSFGKGSNDMVVWVQVSDVMRGSQATTVFLGLVLMNDVVPHGSESMVTASYTANSTVDWPVQISRGSSHELFKSWNGATGLRWRCIFLLDSYVLIVSLKLGYLGRVPGRFHWSKEPSITYVTYVSLASNGLYNSLDLLRVTFLPRCHSIYVLHNLRMTAKIGAVSTFKLPTLLSPPQINSHYMIHELGK